MVSVIIPVYNSAKTLRACIESALSQSYTDIEVIAVNDGSADNCIDILREYARCDKRLKVVDKENGGVSSARNKGLCEAHGEYIVFLDADDRLDKNALDRLVKIVKSDVDMVVGSYTQFRGEGNNSVVTRNSAILALSDIRDDMERYDPLFDTPWAKLFKRSIILNENIRFDESLALGEDHKFNLQYLKKCSAVAVTDENVYYYRLGGLASANRYYKNKIQLNLELLKSYEEFFGGIDAIPSGFLKKKVRDQLFGCVRHFYIFCSRKDAEKKVLETLEQFSCYLSSVVDNSRFTQREVECITAMDSRGLINCVLRKERVRLVAKKIRTMLKHR